MALESIDKEIVKANNDTAIWLIEGYKPGPLAQGAMATAENGAVSYPASPHMGLLHDELGTGLAAFFKGDKDAATTLADIEQAYLVAAKEAGLL